MLHIFASVGSFLYWYLSNVFEDIINCFVTLNCCHTRKMRLSRAGHNLFLYQDLESLALADIEQELALTEVEKKEELAALNEAAAEADQQGGSSKGSTTQSQTMQEEEAHQKAMEAAFAADVEGK